MQRLTIAGVIMLALVLSVASLGCGSTATPTVQPSPTATALVCNIPWYDAKNSIGERLTVCGPVVDAQYDADSEGKPTFLHIGTPYPDPARVTVIIWGVDRSRFPWPPESQYFGKTIAVTGLITAFEDDVQINVTGPDQIQEGLAQ